MCNSDSILIYQLTNCTLYFFPLLTDGKRKYVFSKGEGSDEPYDHGKDTEEFFKVSRDFCEAMRLDHSITTAYEVKLITKVHDDFFIKFK